MIVTQILVLALTIVATNTACDKPQKSYFLSYSALSKADTLAKVFQEVNSKILTYQSTTTDSSVTYTLTNIRPQLFYSEHYQTQSFIDEHDVKVVMGVVEAAMNVNYSIRSDIRTKLGYIHVKTHLNQNTFVKKVTLNDGFIQWQTEQIDNLTLTQKWIIEKASPLLTEDEQSVINALLNDQTPSKTRQLYMDDINRFFKPALTKHLNSQQLIASNNFTYKYNNISLNYDNLVVDFHLDNKGLEAFIKFGLNDSSQQCADLPKTFDEQYGGIQQVFAINNTLSMFKKAVEQGLLNVTMSSNWEVPTFQFYMGDLANSVKEASKQPAGNRFDVQCSFPPQLMPNIKVTSYSSAASNELYVSAPERCVISYKSVPIIAVNFTMSIVVKLVAQEQSVRATIVNTGISASKYQNLNAQFKLTNPYMADYAISEVLYGLVNKTTFGNQFPTLKRKYPAISINDSSLTIFDGSEK